MTPRELEELPVGLSPPSQKTPGGGGAPGAVSSLWSGVLLGPGSPASAPSGAPALLATQAEERSVV